MLQIMEEGVLTDSTGRRVSFRNAIVVMTSNVGGQLRGEGLGFCAAGRAAEMGEALRQSFSPEFLGRIDRTVHFSPLGKEAMEAIAGKYLRQLQERTAAAGTQLLLPEGLAGSCWKNAPERTEPDSSGGWCRRRWRAFGQLSAGLRPEANPGEAPAGGGRNFLLHLIYTNDCLNYGKIVTKKGKNRRKRLIFLCGGSILSANGVKG